MKLAHIYSDENVLVIWRTTRALEIADETFDAVFTVKKRVVGGGVPTGTHYIQSVKKSIGTFKMSPVIVLSIPLYDSLYILHLKPRRR